METEARVVALFRQGNAMVTRKFAVDIVSSLKLE